MIVSHLTNPRRSYNSLIKKYSGVKRQPFPTIDPFPFESKDKEFDGLKLTTFEYKKVGNPKALIFFLPGFGESVNYYGYFFRRMAESGYAVYGFDQRGTGMS